MRRRRFQLVVLGAGEPRFEGWFHELARAFPQQVAYQHQFSEKRAHVTEAGADLFLMPSRYEPCGLNQMYSLRYGSVPIVRRTGGLSDSVVPFDPGTGTGTGVVFSDYSAEAVGAALEEALDLYHQSGPWERLVRTGMAQDFSWSRQVRRYVQLYEQLLARG